MDGLRMGNRGDREISWAARGSLGDFRASMLILQRQSYENQASTEGSTAAALTLRQALSLSVSTGSSVASVLISQSTHHCPLLYYEHEETINTTELCMNSESILTLDQMIYVLGTGED